MDDESMNFDLDSDGVPDVVVMDTNGKTAYVSLSFLLKLGGSLIAAVSALVAAYVL